MYNTDNRPESYNLADREVDETGRVFIPTDWAETDFIIDYEKSQNYEPIGGFALPHQIYSDAAKRREEILQLSAIGTFTTEQDFDTVRQQMADKITNDEEALMIESAVQASQLGVEPQKISAWLEAPLYKDLEKIKNYSLEVVAAEQEREKALENNSDILAYELDPANDTVASFAKSFAAGNLIAKFAANAENMRTPDDMVEEAFWTISRFIPGVEYATIQATDPLEVKKGLSTITTRKAQQDIVWSIAEDPSLTEEQKFAAFSLISDNLPAGLKANFWNEMTKTASVLPDLGAIGDLVGGMSMARRVARTANTAKLSEAAKAGNKTEVIEETAEILSEDRRILNQSPEKQGRLLTYISDSAAQTTPDPNLPNYKRAVEETVRENIVDSEAAKKYMAKIRPEAMSEAQEQRQYKAFKETIENEIVAKSPKKDILNYVHINPEYTPEGNMMAVLDIGTGDKGSFSFIDKATAEAAAKKHLPYLSGAYEVYTDGNGWKIRAKMSIPEQGHILEDWKGEFIPRLRHGGRIFSRRGNLTREQHAQDVALKMGKNAARDFLDSQYLSKYLSLSSKEKEGFDAVRMQGMLEQKWYDEGYRTSTYNFNEKQNQAYEAYKDLSRLNLESTDNYVWNTLTRQGYKNISLTFNKKEYIGKQILSIKDEDFVNMSVKDLSRKKVYNFGELKAEDWKQLQNEKDYTMIRLKGPEMEDGVPVRYVMGPRSIFKQSELKRGLVPEIEGGHYIYNENMVFIKTPVSYKVNNRDILLTPRTLYGEMDKPAAIQYAKEVNGALKTARDYYAGKMTRAAATAELNRTTAVNDYFKVGSMDEMEEYLRSKANPNGILELDHDVEVVRGGEELQQVAAMKAKGALEYYDQESLDNANTLFDLINLNGKGYWSRGKALKTLDGHLSPVLNTRKMMERNINDIIRLDLQEPYTQNAAREFRELFGDILDEDLLRVYSDEQVLLSKDIIKTPAKGADMSKYKAARYFQDNYRVKASVKTDSDRLIESYMTGLAESIADKDFMRRYNLLQRDSKGFEFIQRLNPADAIKASTFNYLLGAFNSTQAIKQAAGAVTALSLSPVQASRILSRYPSIRMALSATDAEHYKAAIDSMKKSKIFTNGFSEEEATAVVDVLKRISALDTKYNRTGSGSYKYLKGLQDANLMFFNLGENLNAVTAHGAATLEYLKANPEKLGKALTNRDILKIAQKGEEYYGLMSKGSDTVFQNPDTKTWWFDQGLKMVSQFFAYPTAWLEMLTGDFLTAGQRASLGLTGLAMWGTAGTLGGSAGYWAYKSLADLGVNPEVTEIVTTGIPDAIARNFFDTNTSIYKLGPGVGEATAWKYPLDILDDGQINILNAIPGKYAINVWLDAPKTAVETLGMLKNLIAPDEDNNELWEHIINLSQLSTPSSIGLYARAALALKYKELYNKRGQIIARDVDAGDVVKLLLGVGGSEQDVQEYLRKGVTEKDKVMKDFIKEAESRYSAWEKTGSPSARQDYIDWNADARSTMTNKEKRLYSKMLKTMMSKQKGWRTQNERYIKDFYTPFKSRYFDTKEIKQTLERPRVKKELRK